jgi:hypothetical protein
MSKRLRTLALSCAALMGVSSFLLASDAHACGGCFHPIDDPETTVVTGHRMALSISPTQTVLWDQVEYTGNPAEFAWVLPIKEGATLELGTNAWFEALDAATSTRVIAPNLNCFQAFPPSDGGGSGFSCCYASDSAGQFESNAFPGDDNASPVTVVKRETVGPYEVVTLSADIPGVLVDWLNTNGFAVDAGIEPVIDQYTQEGFDFIAMRLQPGQGVQNMKPVRVLSPGATPTLPLRMVAAGTGANTAVTLYVIGEGRWEAQNFKNVVADAKDITWDFATTESDYAEKRLELLGGDSGRTWISAYSKKGALLSPTMNSFGNVSQYSVDGTGPAVSTIAELYVATGRSNLETIDGSCGPKLLEYAQSIALVVNPCASGTCGAIEPGQIDARDFACFGSMGKKDFADLAVALTGLHPQSVWVTRLEGNLSRLALELDLQLEAHAEQTEVDNWLQAGLKKNPPCEESATTAPFKDLGSSSREKHKRTEFAAAVAAFLLLGAAIARRARRSLLPSYSN